MRKNVIRTTEWKKLYPMKKIILALAWLFAVIVLYAGFLGLIEDHDPRTIIVIVLDGAVLIKSFLPIKNYIFTSYHCIPVFNQIFTKKELEELFEGEVVQKMTGSIENPFNSSDLLESENWFCIHGKFISKNMAILGRAWVAGSLNNRDRTSVKVFYMTGQYLEVKAGYSWRVSMIQSFNRLLWETYQIIPAKIFSRDYEWLSTILKNTYDRIKTEKGLCEKEFVRYLLEDGADSKALFQSEIPGFQLPEKNK